MLRWIKRQQCTQSFFDDDDDDDSSNGAVGRRKSGSNVQQLLRLSDSFKRFGYLELRGGPCLGTPLPSAHLEVSA